MDTDDARNGAAFFDLDRTLISGASTIALARAAWRAGMIPVADLARDLAGNVVFQMAGATDERSEQVRERILAAVAGTEQADLLALKEHVIPQLLERVRPEATRLLQMHTKAGRDTYIVSASPIEVVAPLADELGMTGGIGTTSTVVDGRYTGTLDGPFVYGEGKAEAIRDLAEERGYDLRLSYAYSDSASDLPMFELVGHPVAVNAERELSGIARRRGWPRVVFARRRKVVVRTTTAIAGAAALASGTYVLGRRHGRRTVLPLR